MTISRRDALRVAAEVLERSDWLATDLLADEGDEDASENADRIVEILRDEVARMGEAVKPVPPLIRITVDYANGRNTLVKEFTEVAEADSWLVGDSYNCEPYVRRLTWERLR